MSSKSAVRVVVSGSREFDDTAVIRAILEKVWRSARAKFGDVPVILVHGNARGADQLAAAEWSHVGLPTETHPARWVVDGKKDRGAGFKRNIAMLEAGADLVVAFHVERSPGTEHTVKEAVKRGIPVWLIAVRDGVLLPPLSVTKDNVRSVYPDLRVVPGQGVLDIQPEAERQPVFHDAVAGFDRCGSCGRARHDGSLCGSL